MDAYSSTTSSTSIGHAFAQMPQAIHLEAGLPSVTTIRPNGHGSAHLPLRTGDRADYLLLYDLQTCLVRIELFIKCFGTGLYTGQTCHTGTAFFYFQFLHIRLSSVFVFSYFNTNEKNSQYITKRFDKIMTD